MEARILVVDDEPVILLSVQKALKPDSYWIDTAQSAEEALQLLSAASYDIVITDLMMPGMDGLGLLDHLRTLGRDPLTIMITGYPTIQTAFKAKRLGAFEYVTKPFTRQELRSVVVRALRQREHQRSPHDGPAASRPAGKVYTFPGHAWARLEPDGTARVGMDREFADSLGPVADLRLPGVTDSLQQGRTFVVILATDGVEHMLHAPLSGAVVEINPAVVGDAPLAGRDPEGAGWLVRLRPLDPERELENLVPWES